MVRLKEFLAMYMLPVGLFIQLSCVIWLGSSAQLAQTNIWLLFPGVIFIFLSVYKFGTLKFRSLKSDWLEIFVGLFLGYGLLSLVWSDTDESFSRMLKSGLSITVYLFVLKALSVQQSRLIKLLWATSVVVALGAILSLMNHYLINGEPFGYRLYRVYSIGVSDFGDFKNPILSGLYHACFTSIIFVWLCTNKKNMLANSASCFLFLFLLIYLLLTWSRGPWISISVSMVTLAFLINSKKSKLFLITAGLFFILIVSQYHQPLWTIFFGDDLGDGVNSRSMIWKTAIEDIFQKPIIGHGWEAKFLAKGPVYATHPHSYYLKVLHNFGLVGGVFFTGIILSAIYKIKKYWNEPVAKYALGILIVGLVAMITDVYRVIERPGYVWVIFWLPIGLTIGLGQQQQVDPVNSWAKTDNIQ